MLVQEAICRNRPFQDDVRPMLFNRGQEPTLHPPARFLQHTFCYVYAGIFQTLYSTAGDQREWIALAHHHMLHTTCDQQVRTGWCATVMRTRFQVHVECCIGGNWAIAKGAQTSYFCMGATSDLVPTFCQYMALLHQYSANERVRRSGSNGLLSQFQAALHPRFVAGSVHCGAQRCIIRRGLPGYFCAPPIMRVATNTVGSLLDLYKSELSPVFGVAEARAMARIVFRQTFGWDVAELDAQRTTALSESELLKVYTPLTRLRTGEPLQYVLGHTWFMGMELEVAPGVLIPRPETEELVDMILRGGRPFSRVLDIGTGSGCIALALKNHRVQAMVTGMDVSLEALAVAQRNGTALGLSVEWLHGDVLDQNVVMPCDLDLVVSNPPYVPRAEYDSLEPHVRDHEPHLALFVDDHDSLLFYRVIGQRALQALMPGGELWFEGHYRYAAAVAELLTTLGYSSVRLLNDLSGSPRFIHAIR